MKPTRTKPSLLFRLVVPATVVFILTILALIACLFGNPDAPVSAWLNRNGNQILIVEFVLVVVLSGLAMVVDRIRTLKGLDEEPTMPSAPAPTDVTAGTQNSDRTND